MVRSNMVLVSQMLISIGRVMYVSSQTVEIVLLVWAESIEETMWCCPSMATPPPIQFFKFEK